MREQQGIWKPTGTIQEIGLALLAFILLRYVQLWTTAGLTLWTASTSKWRLAILPLGVLTSSLQFTIILHDALQSSLPRIFLSGLCAEICFTFTFSSTVLLALRLENPAISRISNKKRDIDKLSWILSFANNRRCIGTPFRIRNIPVFDSSRPTHVPSRREVILQRLQQIAIAYLVRHGLLSIAFGKLYDGLFWCIYYRFYIDLLQSLSVIGGLISGRNPQDYPPDFGTFSQTITVRGFWGKFWHQNLRFTFTALSTYLCKDIWGLKGLDQRYANITVVFAMSAIFHILCDRAVGIPWDASGAGTFFLSQPLGIVLEDTVQYFWRTKVIYWSEHHRLNLVTNWVSKLVGYVWTWSFLSYTAGWYMAPYNAIFSADHRLIIVVLDKL